MQVREGMRIFKGLVKSTRRTLKLKEYFSFLGKLKEYLLVLLSLLFVVVFIWIGEDKYDGFD